MLIDWIDGQARLRLYSPIKRELEYGKVIKLMKLSAMSKNKCSRDISNRENIYHHTQE